MIKFYSTYIHLQFYLDWLILSSFIVPIPTFFSSKRQKKHVGKYSIVVVTLMRLFANNGDIIIIIKTISHLYWQNGMSI